MQRLDKLPKSLVNRLRSEHEKALAATLNKKRTIILPMHTAKMSMLYDGESQLRQTIIPEIIIGVDDIIDEQYLDSRNIWYVNAYNMKPIPLSHVYGSSGYLCFGSIFVPQLIPAHSPQQPLETLFLHNDRNISHGNPEISITTTQCYEIDQLLTDWLPNEEIDTQQSWVKNDTLWVIGTKLLETYSKNDAYTKMDKIFKIIFKN